MADIQSQLPVRLTDGTNTVAIDSTSLAVSVSNFPSTQPVSGTFYQATQPVSGTVTNVPSGTQPVSGTFYQATQPVSGSVSVANSPTVTVGNFPATQPVSGTVTNVPSGTQAVSGTVTNVPSGTQAVSGTFYQATQPVSGTVTSVPSGTQAVSGTLTATVTELATDETAGGICVATTTATVANASTATVPYTVTAAKVLWIKGVLAASSGGPCKVIVDNSDGKTYATAFYSAANPTVEIAFSQPQSLAAGKVLNIKIQNNAGAAQDVYCTLFGREVSA